MGRLVGGHAEGINRIVLDLINSRHIQGARHDGMIDRVGRAHIGDDLVSDAEHGAVFFERHLDVMNLIAPVTAVAQVLHARLAPFNRTGKLAREKRQEQLFLVSLNLDAKRAAHVRRDDANPALGKAQDIRDARPQRMRIGGRRPHR